ncbi:MAG: hypothetical protein AAFX01_08870 [Cyanobacteria bacterium J06638_28]
MDEILLIVDEWIADKSLQMNQCPDGAGVEKLRSRLGDTSRLWGPRSQPQQRPGGRISPPKHELERRYRNPVSPIEKAKFCQSSHEETGFLAIEPML